MLFDQDIQVRGLYRHALVEQMDDGTIYMGLPERLFWEQRNDTDLYVCGEGEYLFDIVAGHYGRVYDQPWFVAEIVAQFQPLPLIDISVPLRSGYELQLPSTEYIETVALGETYADTPEL